MKWRVVLILVCIPPSHFVFCSALFFGMQAGRVNGNLNLSRSIGDLKYKANDGLPPADQMITAEPDVRSVLITDDDRFIILACDGVWDCMTSQQVCAWSACGGYPKGRSSCFPML